MTTTEKEETLAYMDHSLWTLRNQSHLFTYQGVKWPSSKFKKEGIKMLKKLRKVIDKNVAHCDNELKTIKMSQSIQLLK